MADDTLIPAARATCWEPTGWAVPMYSVTTASRMAALRGSSERAAAAPSWAWLSAIGPSDLGIGAPPLGWQSILPSARPRHAPATVRPGGGGPAAHSSSRSAEMNASWGTSTRPMVFIRFLPSFWRSKSLRLRVMSPP